MSLKLLFALLLDVWAKILPIFSTLVRILVVVMPYPIFSHSEPFIGANTH